MSEIPGGPLANRPLHFVLLLDCFTSMGVAGRSSQLTTPAAMPAAMPAAADEDTDDVK